MPTRILAVASGDGLGVQLLRLAFEGLDVAYVTVQDSYSKQVSGNRFYRITDATRRLAGRHRFARCSAAALARRARTDATANSALEFQVTQGSWGW